MAEPIKGVNDGKLPQTPNPNTSGDSLASKTKGGQKP